MIFSASINQGNKLFHQGNNVGLDHWVCLINCSLWSRSITQCKLASTGWCILKFCQPVDGFLRYGRDLICWNQIRLALLLHWMCLLNPLSHSTFHQSVKIYKSADPFATDTRCRLVQLIYRRVWLVCNLYSFSAVADPNLERTNSCEASC